MQADVGPTSNRLKLTFCNGKFAMVAGEKTYFNKVPLLLVGLEFVATINLLLVYSN